MSIAHPDAIIDRGHVHEDIVRAARWIQDNGWRVTSIYRPGTGTHATGRSMDIAPIVYVAGGFGEKTALLVWELLKRYLPSRNWLVVAELDHLHVQLYAFDAIGRNTQSGTVLRRIVKP